jgi:branched-chain amino acid transport system ATP-binding protein
MAMLEVDHIDTYYGNIRALEDVSLSVDEGEIVTLIGANGAGKSTTLDTISGLLKPRKGGIYLEGRRIFGRLTVMENLEMGAFIRSDRVGIAQDLERVFTLFPRLKERVNQVGGTLSGGEQQMLAIGRALMARPRVLLLDEPSMGLAPLLVESIFETIESINAEGTTVLLVEQNALMALSIAHRGYVLQAGRIVLHDTPGALEENEMVRKAYLGED